MRPQLVSPTNWTAKSARPFGQQETRPKERIGSFLDADPSDESEDRDPVRFMFSLRPGWMKRGGVGSVDGHRHAERFQLVDGFDGTSQIAADRHRMDGAITDEFASWPVRGQLEVVEPVDDADVRELPVEGRRPARHRCCRQQPTAAVVGGWATLLTHKPVDPSAPSR